MKRIRKAVAWAIVIACLLITVQALFSAERIQRVVVGDTVKLVYLVEADHEPIITAGAAYITSRALVQDGPHWRLTVNATLPLCSGALAVDGVTLTSQRCYYFPVGAK
jgi:hypothetical protein